MSKNGLAKNAGIPIVGVVRVEPRVHDMDGVHRMAFHGPCGLLLYGLDFRHLKIFIDSYRTYVLTSVVLASHNACQATLHSSGLGEKRVAATPLESALTGQHRA